MDEMMRELLDLEAHMQAHQEVLNALYQQITTGEEIVRFDDRAFLRLLLIDSYAG
jgi:hypothetical protein